MWIDQIKAGQISEDEKITRLSNANNLLFMQIVFGKWQTFRIKMGINSNSNWQRHVDPHLPVASPCVQMEKKPEYLKRMNQDELKSIKLSKNLEIF